MANRLVSGGGAGRLLDEVGEGSGLGDHRPDSSGEASRVSARTTSTVLAAQLRPAHTPIEETIATLNDLVRDRKIRYIGLSDTPAWAVARAAVIADFRGWAPISSNRLIFLLRAAVQQRRSRHVCRRMPSGSARRAPESTARRRRRS